MRLAGLCVVALILQACGADKAVDADAAAREALAVRAIGEAKSMPPGYHRDIALRSISRNLRWVDCDLAMEAAAAMEETYEVQRFGRCPDDLSGMEPPPPGKVEEPSCMEGVRGLIEESSGAVRDRRIRDAFDIGGPPRVVYGPPCSYEATIMAADALPPGETKAVLFRRAAMADFLPNSTEDRRRAAVNRLRALLPQLDGNVRKEAEGWLDSGAVDLLEGRPDAAIDRLRRTFDPREAHELITHFLRAKDVERAVTVTRLLPSSEGCTTIREIFLQTLPQHDRQEPAIGVYFDRLRAAGHWDRLCPNGVEKDIGPDAWLKAGKENEALAAAAATRVPIRLALTRADVADRRLQAGDREGARSVILAALAAVPALDTGTAMDRATAARTRIRIIDQLVQIDETEEAERLAAAFPGPGWRGFAYSVMAAAKGKLAGRKAAVFERDLSEVPTDR